jgi:hypothetical protein
MPDVRASRHLRVIEEPCAPAYILPNAQLNEPGIKDMATLLHDFGGDAWDIVRLDDGRLAARRRNGQTRPNDPFAVFASTPEEMHALLSSALRLSDGA